MRHEPICGFLDGFLHRARRPAQLGTCLGAVHVSHDRGEAKGADVDAALLADQAAALLEKPAKDVHDRHGEIDAEAVPPRVSGTDLEYLFEFNLIIY